MILVCGATGFVGQSLLPELARAGAGPLRGLVRREFDAVRLRDSGFEAVAADIVEGRGLDSAVRGVETLVYLVHTLDRAGDVVANDLEAAQNTMLAARAAGVRRVVFLGHVAASEEAAAAYLVARWAAELAVRQSGLEQVIVRAPMIVGRGAALFELLRRIADRNPVVPLFGWRRTAVEPVALGDVVEALRMAALDPELDGRTLDVCGPARMTFGDVLRGWTRANGKRPALRAAAGRRRAPDGGARVGPRAAAVARDAAAAGDVARAADLRGPVAAFPAAAAAAAVLSGRGSGARGGDVAKEGADDLGPRDRGGAARHHRGSARHRAGAGRGLRRRPGESTGSCARTDVGARRSSCSSAR